MRYLLNVKLNPEMISCKSDPYICTEDYVYEIHAIRSPKTLYAVKLALRGVYDLIFPTEIYEYIINSLDCNLYTYIVVSMLHLPIRICIRFIILS